MLDCHLLIKKVYALQLISRLTDFHETYRVCVTGSKQAGGRGASNGASGTKAAGITLSGAAGIRAGVPLSAQQLAAAIQLGSAGQTRFMPPQLLQQATTATLAPIHLQPQQQPNANNKKLASKQQQQQQPVSLTIVTPASGAVGPHQTLLLQPQPPTAQATRDGNPPAEPQLLS